jgi:superfamily II DNA or RNA helicase
VVRQVGGGGASDHLTKESPEPGQLVHVRDRQWVVADVLGSTQTPDVLAVLPEFPQHVVHLVSVDDDGFGDELDVIWELEPGRRVVEATALPEPRAGRFDHPAHLDAFLDAVRWGAIASADARALQAPFRAGIAIEEYQLEPVVRALRMPRVNLLIADDVGLGKTIEAGLVVQELLLRHRARTVIVVCPASLCVQWQTQMHEKFGLEFRIVDSDLLRHLRRTRGLYANPWSHYPRLITSIDWLKRERPMALMKETLPPGLPGYPRRFDVLIVDEVHGAAPTGTGRYAIDSQRTQALRTLAPHCEHRLFLSATPHNGRPESFTALLELLDPQRFARSVPAEPARVRQVMVRRLKSDLPPRWDGTPMFPRRVIVPLQVDYPDHEREAHRLLNEYAVMRSRHAAMAGLEQRLATDFVLTLLKKRLFSSPAAFASTLEEHRLTMEGRQHALARPTAPVLRRSIETVEEEYADDQAYGEAVGDALTTAARAFTPLTHDERGHLEGLREWAQRARGRPDAKASELLRFLDATVRPRGRWGDERVIVFTEYRDTQNWLQDLLASHGLGGRRLRLLFGGMDPETREDIKQRFLASPDLDPVRILLATDAASEGIDLHHHCHRLVHYEIPWNPNRLEQRNGRIDRHGQPAAEVLVHHFVGAGWERADPDLPGSLEGDLYFLFVAARKVEQIREDLGSVGPVIAEQVQDAMLGRRRALDTKRAEESAPSRRLLQAERDLREQVARLHDRIQESRRELHMEPERVRHVVQVGLQLARQPPLQEVALDRPGTAFRVPPLKESWREATIGLSHPVTGSQRPITFDSTVAAGRDDVVYAHAGHRLVQLATSLLRSEVWRSGPSALLARVTARVVPDSDLGEPVVAAHGRLVITGVDGHRLHEEVIEAGAVVRGGGFGRRLGVDELRTALAVATEVEPSTAVQERFALLWPALRTPLTEALNRRSRERAQSLSRQLAQRQQEEVAAVSAVLSELRRSIETQLHIPAVEQLGLFSADERQQYDRDLDALRRRLREIPSNVEAEMAAIQARYTQPEARLFPAAITFLVPRTLAAG